MKHPQDRAERRFNGEVWRSRQRFKMKQTWYLGRKGPDYLEDNNMWWARKQSSAHGNRCMMCHYEKHSRKYKRKRRRALKEGTMSH